MINRSTDGKQRVLSLSYGKDSLACLGAIEQLGLPLDRIVHAEVWATDTIQADLPPMVEFKAKADAIIKERWGFEVEHYAAQNVDGIYKNKISFEDVFYKTLGKGKHIGAIKGFPMSAGRWCQKLKLKAVELARNENLDCISYLGIAADEPNRFSNLSDKQISPLVEIGWTEADCRKWCEDNNLLSPIYTSSARGGCWFCPVQPLEQLRILRKSYPDLWSLLLKWDKDSPLTFHADGHTVHDFDHRFQLEDEGLIDPKATFRWSMLDDNLQYTIFKN